MMNRFEYDDHDWLDDDGREYMTIEEHDEVMEDFKAHAIDVLKQMILAIDKDDKIALMEAIDEMADHLGATI